MAMTSFKYGARVVLDPRWNGDLKVKGPQVKYAFKKAVKPCKDFSWDWPNSRLIVDNDYVKAVIGAWGKSTYTFKDGFEVKLTDFKKQNGKAPFVCFTLVSTDKKKLKDTDKAVLSVVSYSHNTGFKYVPTHGVANLPKHKRILGQPRREVLNGVKDVGKAPVIVNRVGCKVKIPMSGARICTKIDFALKSISRKKVNNTISISREEPVFITWITKK